MHEEATEKVKTQSSDLKQLAQECMKAFEVSDLIHSEDVPVKRAVNLKLCSAYLPQTKQKSKHNIINCKFVETANKKEEKKEQSTSTVHPI